MKIRRYITEAIAIANEPGSARNAAFALSGSVQTEPLLNGQAAAISRQRACSDAAPAAALSAG